MELVACPAKHLVVAARGATRLLQEGAQGACMNSHAVGPRSLKGRQASTETTRYIAAQLRGAQGCQPPDSVARATPS